MAFRANSWVEITPIGEKAWRDSDLPLIERRLLNACHSRIALKELYLSSGELLSFEETIQSLVRKGFLSLKDSLKDIPHEDSIVDSPHAEESIEIADVHETPPQRSSGLRDLLGRIHKSHTSGSHSSSHENPSESDPLSPIKKDVFSLWGGKPSVGREEIAEDLNEFARQLMSTEETGFTDDEEDVPEEQLWYGPSLVHIVSSKEEVLESAEAGSASSDSDLSDSFSSTPTSKFMSPIDSSLDGLDESLLRLGRLLSEEDFSIDQSPKSIETEGVEPADKNTVEDKNVIEASNHQISNNEEGLDEEGSENEKFETPSNKNQTDHDEEMNGVGDLPSQKSNLFFLPVENLTAEEIEIESFEEEEVPFSSIAFLPSQSALEELMGGSEEDDDEEGGNNSLFNANLFNYPFTQMPPSNSFLNESEDSEETGEIAQIHPSIHPTPSGWIKPMDEEAEDEYEDDEPIGTDDWLNESPAVFQGALSEESLELPSSKLNESVERLAALESERRAASERGKVLMEKKRLEEEAIKQSKMASPEVRRKIEQAEAEREATSFNSMSAELKAIRSASRKNEDQDR